jgi:hypothetical protein
MRLKRFAKKTYKTKEGGEGGDVNTKNKIYRTQKEAYIARRG